MHAHHDKGIVSLIGVRAPLLLFERDCKSTNNMNKNQIFDFIVDKCASVCNVPAEDIKGASRRADVVDARCLVFRFAIQEYDFTPRDIATLLGKDNPKAVRSLYQSFDTRCDRSYCFRELSNTLCTELSEKGA